MLVNGKLGENADFILLINIADEPQNLQSGFLLVT